MDQASISSKTPVFFLILTAVLGLLCQLISLPHALWVLRPNFTLLTIIFWMIYKPYQISLIWIFVYGLFMDAALGHWLGVYGLIYPLTGYLSYLIHMRLQTAAWINQAFMVGVLVGVQMILFIIIQSFSSASLNLSIWLQVFTSVLVWPFWAAALLWLSRLR
jgi:rod shape-determining protein MreD